jgi:hypothetical protein
VWDRLLLLLYMVSTFKRLYLLWTTINGKNMKKKILGIYYIRVIWTIPFFGWGDI